MYAGFDAMVLPRRYAGLCLPMNEALMSALPVFMTNVSPNDYILPKEWLIKSTSLGTFRTKVRIELFDADIKELALSIDTYMVNKNKEQAKQKAFDIGMSNFSPSLLINEYKNLISHI
jgi:hypothetical protein